MVRKKNEVRCPKCKGKNVIKKGKRRNKYQTLQKYKCKDCGLSFIGERKLDYTTYSARVVLSAINNFNKGLSLQESSKEINKRFGVRTYPKLISSWIKRYEDLLPYLRIRRNLSNFGLKKGQALKGKGKEEDVAENVVFSKLFDHKQPYLYKYHKVKLDMFINEYFSPIADYLQHVPETCPNDLFLEDNIRCSQFKLTGVKGKTAKYLEISRKHNYACKLADFALNAVRNNKERHEFVEEFMLLNDTATIACEVPLWMLPNEIPVELRGLLKDVIKVNKPITGHLDILQTRYGMIYLLDYKPEAYKVNAVSQLFFYALALSVRTNVWLRNFRCAWFDDKDYFEFNPNDLVIPVLKKGVEGMSKEECRSCLRKYVSDEDARRFYTSKQFHEIYQREKNRREGQKGEKNQRGEKNQKVGSKRGNVGYQEGYEWHQKELWERSSFGKSYLKNSWKVPSKRKLYLGKLSSKIFCSKICVPSFLKEFLRVRVKRILGRSDENFRGLGGKFFMNFGHWIFHSFLHSFWVNFWVNGEGGGI